MEKKAITWILDSPFLRDYRARVSLLDPVHHPVFNAQISENALRETVGKLTQATLDGRLVPVVHQAYHKHISLFYRRHHHKSIL